MDFAAHTSPGDVCNLPNAMPGCPGLSQPGAGGLSFILQNVVPRESVSPKGDLLMYEYLPQLPHMEGTVNCAKS